MLFCKPIKRRGSCMSTINDYLLSAIMVEITWKPQNFLSFCKNKIADLLCVLYIHFYYYEHNHSSNNNFSRLRITSLFTICNIVYFTTLQKPFNSGRSFTIHANVIECTQYVSLLSITVRYIGTVNVNNHELLSTTPSQTSEKTPNPSIKSFNATNVSCKFKEGHNSLMYNASDNFHLHFIFLYPFSRIWKLFLDTFLWFLWYEC